jgi:hypothetical protein
VYVAADPDSATVSPAAKTVPAMPSRRFAVASSPLEPQSAMSAAPTSTGSPADAAGGVPTVISPVLTSLSVPPAFETVRVTVYVPGAW